MFSTSKVYSLLKSHNILKSGCKWYKKRGKELPSDRLKFFEEHLQNLDQAILQKDQAKASQEAHIVEEFSNDNFKKSIWEYSWEVFFAIIIALAIATVVRQMWFELYEIPTGSMRPTFKEQDHLTVTKTAFGINVPLKTEHFYFDPSLVQRTSVVIWSGDNMPHLDSDSTFMHIFPYTKRFIKRNMGKPGDTLYFYGGKIYGFDKDGNDLIEMRESPYLAKLDYVPFTHFEGRHSYIENPKSNAIDQVVFYLMNEPLGRIRFFRNEMKGEVLNGQKWVRDNPEAQLESHDEIKTYSDFWGIRNYAMARILTGKEANKILPSLVNDQERNELYLELRHTPSLNAPEPVLSNHYGVRITGFTTIIPLHDNHLQSIMENMYTCRFEIKNGKARPYRIDQDSSKGPFRTSSPSFPNVPDGVYEFYYGKAYQIGFGAIATELPANHPLYSRTPENIQRLFNVGIEMSTLVEPKNANQFIFPNRYAYFRDGSLYVMGGPIFAKDDPVLKNFNAKEKHREEASTPYSPYIAFKDYGPPLLPDGKLNKEFIRIFGYRIPEGKYLMLGDNHAMSQDSRWFGPVPQANLQGAPSLIIWPPGPRFGVPLQKPYPLFVLPRLIVWAIAASALLIWWILHRRRMNQPFFKKIDFKK